MYYFCYFYEFKINNYFTLYIFNFLNFTSLIFNLFISLDVILILKMITSVIETSIR